MDFQITSDFFHHLRKEVEGHGRSVQLATAMIRQNDPFNTQCRKSLRIVQGLPTLDHQVPRPLTLDPGEVLKGHRWVEHRVEEFADGT